VLKQKLLSRKFAVTVATFIVALVGVFNPEIAAGIDPLALAGLAGVVIAYLGGQSWIDKTVADGQLKVARDEGLLQAQAYIQQLQTQLAAMNALQQSEVGGVPEEIEAS
jgi:hypothetical protein